MPPLEYCKIGIKGQPKCIHSHTLEIPIKESFVSVSIKKMSYACLTMDVVGKKSHLLRMLATFCHCLPTCHNYSRQQSNKKESGANLPSLCLKNMQKHKVESTCFEFQWAPTTFQSKASGTNLTKIFLFLFILL